jgi:hypothetical protein
MNGLTIKLQLRNRLIFPMLAALLVSPFAIAQVPVDENGNPVAALDDNGTVAAAEGTLLSAGELEELVGPVALYPDDLLAIVLPASTYPLEIVQAARFLDEAEADSSLKPDESWDDSVVALLNYPEVLRMMNDDIDWTWSLGEAVIAQQSDVIAAVEAFRDRAYAAGNLKTDERQTVTVEDGAIEIEPADDEIIYVPYYEPAEVVVYQPRRVYYYYPEPYPVYYYPYPLGYDFYGGVFWGVTTAFHIGWSNHYLHVYHPSYWGHPYYGYTYNDYYWYRRPSINVYNTWYVTNTYRTSRYRYRDGDYWRPRHHAGSRPDEPRVRNYYYPPNSTGSSSTSRRDTRSVSNRDRLQVNNDGRMNLNLRERRGTPVRPGNRTANSRADSTRGSFAGSRQAPDTANAGSNRRTTNNRRSEGFASNRGSAGTPSRANNNGRSEIRFRDRSNDGTVANNRSAAHSSTGAANRSGTATRRTPSAASNRLSTGSTVTGRIAQPSRGNSAARTSERRGFTAPSTRPNVTTGRSSGTSVRRGTPTTRSSAPTIRQSAPTTRSTGPGFSSRSSSRSSARPSAAPAPTVRRSAPAARPSAPSRSHSGGSRSAPASSSGSRSSHRGNASSGRRSSSRPTGHD